jgi:glycerol dehydrogenase
MLKKVLQPRLNFVRTGPAQYVNRAGVLRKAAAYIAPWADRVLISGGQKALASVEKLLTKSLDKGEISYRLHQFTGETSVSNIAKVKAAAQKMKARAIVGVGGGKSLDTAKQAAEELKLPIITIPTIAATCAATTALSVTYTDRGVFYRVMEQSRNPSLVIVDPDVLTRSPAMYLRAGILDSLAKWYEGRAVWPGVENPDVPTTAAMELAEMLYHGQRKYAADAVRLNNEQRVGDALIHSLDIVILLTGVIQTLSRGIRFTAIAHSLHNGMTLIPESHEQLHGIKVGYSILVQLLVEKCPKKEFEDAVNFFRQLGLEPSLKGLNMPYDREMILRVSEMAASNPDMGPVKYHVDKFVIASAIEALEKRFG